MLAPSGELLRAGVALKFNHLNRAARSYLRDRTSQATGRATSYAVSAGLFAAAGLFVVAACFVALMALFRWVEFTYGLFWAFGAVSALLLLIAAICAAVASSQLKRQPPHFPSLTSRLRVAIKANPLKPAAVDAAQDTAAAILSEPSTPVGPGSFMSALLSGWKASGMKVWNPPVSSCSARSRSM